MASMIFNNNAESFPSAILIVSAGDSPIQFGRITFSGTIATAENEPATQNDQDGDGIDDFDDDDDDDNGIPDDLEEDCDLDGIVDTYDDDSDCEEEDDSEASASIIEVTPRNDTTLDSGDDQVNLDEEVRLRANCEIDADSLNDQTFSVVSQNGNVILCQFDPFEAEREITCEHEDDLFLPDTIYTATVSGLVCASGDPIAAVSWSWRTTSEADEDGEEEGDREDEEDEEDT